MTTILHTIFVVLGLPRSVPAVIIRMNAILAAMLADKTTFPSPPIAIATVTTHVDALSVAKATQNAASALHSPNTLVSQPTSAAAKADARRGREHAQADARLTRVTPASAEHVRGGRNMFAGGAPTPNMIDTARE